MAGRLSVFGAQALLTSFFGKAAEPTPSMFLALIRNAAPTPYVSGLELDEVVGNGYHRLEIPNDVFNWDNSSAPYIVDLKADAEFDTATDDWGTIRFWALCNAPSGGYTYLTGDFVTPLYINNGDQVVIPAGSLGITLGPFFLTES